MFYNVKPLEWHVSKALIGYKLIAKDCFGNEHHRIDLINPNKISEVMRSVMHDVEMKYKAAILSALEPRGQFSEGAKVHKVSGSWWEGTVVGMYSTAQTPEGYAVQLDGVNNGPVQIYPVNALAPSMKP